MNTTKELSFFGETVRDYIDSWHSKLLIVKKQNFQSSSLPNSVPRAPCIYQYTFRLYLQFLQ